MISLEVIVPRVCLNLSAEHRAQLSLYPCLIPMNSVGLPQYLHFPTSVIVFSAQNARSEN